MLIKSLQAAAGNAVPTDPNFEYVTMLLHGDGTNGAQNNTFLDGSTNNFTITRNGNTTQGTFSPYGSNWSNYFAYNSTAVNYLVSSSVSLSGTFTIEGYVYWDGVGSLPNMFTVGDSALSTGLEVYLSSGNWVVYSNGASRITGAAGVVGQWTYIAVTRSGSTVTLYINGVSQGTWTSSATFSGTIKVGAEFYSSTYYSSMSGYISNFRVNNTTAINSVPTAPLTAISGTIFLTCQGNRFVDNSASPLTITVNGSPSVQRFSPFAPTAAYSAATIGGSGYFDGSGDWLSVNGGSTLQLGSSNFCIEGWFYPTDGTQRYLLSRGDTGSINTMEFDVRLNTNRTVVVTFYYGSGSTFAFTTSNAFVDNQWNHLVICRSGSTWSMFINGSRGATTTQSVTLNLRTEALDLGQLSGVGSQFLGYMGSFREVIGSSVYDPSQTTLTVPTAPLTAITNTQALLNFTNAGIIDNAMMNDLETVGNAQISTSVKKYGTGSLLFNAASANTNYLVTPTTSLCNFSTGSFTIEFWLYPDSTDTSYASGNNATILDTDSSSGTGTDWWVVHQVNSTIIFASNSAVVLQSSASLAATTWQHVAIVRNGSTITIYIDGTSAGSVTYSTTIGGNRRLFIGTQPGQSRWFKGYIDDLRITNGVARYTANFTPPTAAFPNN